MNDKLYSLFMSGGSPELANKLNSSYSVQEYQEILLSEEYKKYAEEYISNFNADGLLLQSLHKLTFELSEMDPKEKNYPALLREKANLIKLTSPILERIYRISKEYELNNVFSNLKIIIDDNEC